MATNRKDVLLREMENLPEPLLGEVLDFVRFLKMKSQEMLDTAALSESSLEKDWLRPEEDKAWENL